MFELLKIGTFLKQKFSWIRVNSPNIKITAKSKKGDAIITTGNNSPVQNAEGDIYNIGTATTAVDYAEFFDELLICFSDETTQRIIKQVKDPLAQRHMKENIGPGMKKWIIDKFKKIPVHVKDSKAPILVKIKTDAVKSLNAFIDTKNEDKFQTAWGSCRDELISFKDL